MATYKVRDPQGNIREISGPDGASDDAVIAQAKLLFSEATPQEKKPLTQIEPAGVGDPTYGMSDGGKFVAGIGKGMTDIAQGLGQVVGLQSRDDVAKSRKLDAPLMDSGMGKFGSGVGQVAAALPTLLIPGANTILGATAVGGGLGLAQPSTSTKETAINVLGGAAAGAGSQFLANKLTGAVAGKLAGIEQKVQDKAAQVAASETASARSAAGNAAQNAYKQLEHLRTLGANRALTAQEQTTVQSLERELAEKALEKLMPAAALKQETSQAYSEAMQTEGQRAAQYAAEKLSREEVKNQIMARIKRYGPAAVGGILGNAIFPGMGGAVGGAATGLVLRPAIRSMINLSSNPAVQHGILSALQGPLNAAGAAAAPMSALAVQGILNQQ